MNKTTPSHESRWTEIVKACVRRAWPPEAHVPDEDEDLLRAGALDSMGWVELLESIEAAAGVKELPDPAESNEPRTVQSLAAGLERASAKQGSIAPVASFVSLAESATATAIAGWGAALGSVRVDAAAVEREYGLESGTLRDGAGIESVTRVGQGEDEASLVLSAALAALDQAGAEPRDIDSIVASSETFVGLPSLGSLLHARLLARETCGVLDVGGACIGLLNGFSVAHSLLAAGMASRVLVVTAEQHSRHLGAGSVPGEFGGLFGDGASAFVLSRIPRSDGEGHYRLHAFDFGCATTYASTLAVGWGADSRLALKFQGEALARAALSRFERILADLELRTGLSRHAASSFATHQPNPRIMEIFARQAGVPLEKFPVVSRTCGNLGSSTCGVALSLALAEHSRKATQNRGPIFLAAVGPGMLWAGAVLS